MNKPAQGKTRPGQGARKVPRLPHEHDESSDSQVHDTPPPVMRRAHDDVAAGRVDTDRGVPMNEAYQRQKGAARPATPDTAKKRGA